MIEYFAGILTGAVLAMAFILPSRKANTKAEEKGTDKALTERLNAEKRARAERIAEQERQHENMMNYTGKEQR